MSSFKYCDEFGEDFNTAIPESIAHIQFGTNEHFLAVVANKEAKCVRVEGVNFYSWRTIETCHKSGSKGKQEISGDLALDAASYQAIRDQWAAIGWDITAGADDGTLSMCDGSVGGGSSAKQKMQVAKPDMLFTSCCYKARNKLDKPTLAYN